MPKVKKINDQSRIGALLYVEWEDASSLLGGPWHDLKDIRQSAGPDPVRSIGWCAADTPDHLVLAPHVYDVGHQTSGDVKIPTTQIRRLQVLKSPKPSWPLDCLTATAAPSAP